MGNDVSSFFKALPFAISFVLWPIIVMAAVYGGAWIFLAPLLAWYMIGLLDMLAGLNKQNEDPNTEDESLFWYRAITLVWGPIQFVTLFGVIWYVASTDHLAVWEQVGVFVVMGIISGTIGINFSHELMHQKSKLERGMADILLSMAMYTHFHSEHINIHHRYVGTPRDPVTARYGEMFYRYFPRVVIGSYLSAFSFERERLERKGLKWSDKRNPFMRYWALQGFMILLAGILGGWYGIAMFLFQAFIAVWQLEVVNYVEHYGLTRKHLGDGKYEYVKPHHSWNADQRFSSWLLINLQRHSDHHYKPDRRFPLLQTYTAADAPQLPYGYPLMTAAAMFPPLWRKLMNRRVRKWREMYYPEITDWTPYNKGLTPMPK